MATIINASGFYKPRSQKYNQRVRTGMVTRANGDVLDYAILTNGAGGSDWGARAAQMAIDAITVKIEIGLEQSIPVLIEKALHSANHQVYWTTRYKPTVYATASIAVIHNQNTLYIGNVGENQIFLQRGERLTQLTLGSRESFKVEDELVDKRRDKVLGLDEKPTIDFGFHIGQTDSEASFQIAQSRGIKGLPLKEDDRIVLSSVDLFTQAGVNGEPKLKDGLSIDLINKNEGKKAIEKLIATLIKPGHLNEMCAAILHIEPPGSNQPLLSLEAIKSFVTNSPAGIYNTVAAVSVITILLFALAGNLIYAWFQPSRQVEQAGDKSTLSGQVIEESFDSEPIEARDNQRLSISDSSQVPTPNIQASTPVPTSAPIITQTTTLESKRVVSSSNVSQSDSPMPTPIITGSLSISATDIISTSEASPTATVASRIYYQPVIQNLGCSAERKNFSPNGQIELKWRWNGQLWGREYLEIRVGPHGGALTSIGKVFAEPNGRDWTWFITPQGYFLDGVSRNYQWQVVHMTGNGRSILARSGRGCFSVE